MPKVVTTVNLDFDEKEEFIKKFGKAELSHFLRQAIHEKLEEKNREATVNLSAVSAIPNANANIITVTQVNEGLDRWIEHAIKCEDLTQLNVMEGKGLKLVQHCKQRYKKVRFGL